MYEFPTILDNFDAAVVCVDLKGFVINWSSKSEQVFGFTREEAIGRRTSELIIPWRFRSMHERGFANFVETRKGITSPNHRNNIYGLRKNGTEIPITMALSAMENYFVAVIIDVSNHERTRQFLAVKKSLDSETKSIDSEFAMNVLLHEMNTPLQSLTSAFEELKATTPDFEKVKDMNDDDINKIANHGTYINGVVNLKIIEWSLYQVSMLAATSLDLMKMERHLLFRNNQIVKLGSLTDFLDTRYTWYLERMHVTLNVALTGDSMDNLAIHGDETRIVQIIHLIIMVGLRSSCSTVDIDVHVVRLSQHFCNITMTVQMLFDDTVIFGNETLLISSFVKFLDGTCEITTNTLPQNVSTNLNASKKQTTWKLNFGDTRISRLIATKKTQLREKYTVLLAEDNNINRRYFERLVGTHFAHVYSAVNGQELIDLWKEHRDNVSIIFTDLNMPIMDGYNATRILRNELDCTVPIVALTTSDTDDERQKCFEVGMNDFISKPVTAIQMQQFMDIYFD